MDDPWMWSDNETAGPVEMHPPTREDSWYRNIIVYEWLGPGHLIGRRATAEDAEEWAADHEARMQILAEQMSSFTAVDVGRAIRAFNDSFAKSRPALDMTEIQAAAWELTKKRNDPRRGR